MTPIAILLAASIAASPSLAEERPLWTGSFQPNAKPVLVSAVAGGIGVRSAAAAVVIAGDATAALGAGLCTGQDPRLAIPAGRTAYLLGPGSPAALVAAPSLPAQAVSAAVPVTTSAGCRLAMLLQTGDVALVGPSGAVEILSQVIPVIADWHELPRGVLVASQGDLLVVGGVDGTLSAIRISDGRRFGGKIAAAAVPGAAWSEGQQTLWFLSRGGALQAWAVASDVPVQVVPGSVAAPGGLVAWGGKRDRGLAWTDMQGDVRVWKDGTLRTIARLPSGSRWPMLVADLDDTGDLSLVVPVDGPAAALVSEEAAGGSFRLVPVAARPAGSPVAFQLDRTSPVVLAFPAGAARGAFQPGDGPPAGRLAADGAILVTGTQVHGLVPGAVTAVLGPPPTGGTSDPGPTGPTGPTGGTGATATEPAKSGFGCSTVPVADALPLLIAPLLLLRLGRRRREAA